MCMLFLCNYNLTLFYNVININLAKKPLTKTYNILKYVKFFYVVPSLLPIVNKYKEN